MMMVYLHICPKDIADFIHFHFFRTFGVSYIDDVSVIQSNCCEIVVLGGGKDPGTVLVLIIILC